MSEARATRDRVSVPGPTTLSMMATLRVLMVSCGLASPLILAACRENVVAPGACPDYCPPSRFEVIDTVFLGSLEREEWARGYLQPHEANGMQVVRDLAGRDSWSLVRFSPFSDSISSDAGLLPIQSVDSFRLNVQVLDATEPFSELELIVHRLPAGIDESWTFDDLTPFFADSTIIGVIAIPDTLGRLSAVLPPDAFPTFEEDSLVTAVGIALRTDSGGFADLASRETSTGRATLLRYVTVESGAELSDSRQVQFDSFVAPEVPPPPADVLAIGGVPAARAFLRVDLPPAIVDSSDIVRATLILVPADPTLGGRGDSLSFHAFALLADVGPKSPFSLPPADTVVRGRVVVAAGSADTIRIDVTHILRPWKGNTVSPRAMLLSILPEASTLGEVRLFSSQSGPGAPSLHITYVPLSLVEEL